jgi:ABC-type cobalamin/Fe3+-siderophores transport system ATPase subunit
VLELKSIIARRSDFTLELNDIKFNKGSINLLIGPNGSGKTSLFKSMLGVIDSKRQIFIDDKEFRPKDFKSMARLIAYLPQSIYPGEFLVKDLLIQGRFPYTGFFSQYKASDWERVYIIAERFGLKEHLMRDVSTLSQGEFQRVILAKVFVQEASILLLDEPTTSLDIGFKHLIKKYIASYMQLRPESIVVISSHEPEIFLDDVSDVLMLKNGRVFMHGDKNTVYTPDNIKNLFDLF